MIRNRQIIRQWQILRRLDTSAGGVTIRELAAEHQVHWRTIVRDLAALQAAGFPLYDEARRGRVLAWRKVLCVMLDRGHPPGRAVRLLHAELHDG